MHPPSLHRDSTKKHVARKRSAYPYKYKRLTAEGRRRQAQRRSPNHLACNEPLVSKHFTNEGREKHAVFEHFIDEGSEKHRVLNVMLIILIIKRKLHQARARAEAQRSAIQVQTGDRRRAAWTGAAAIAKSFGL